MRVAKSVLSVTAIVCLMLCSSCETTGGGYTQAAATPGITHIKGWNGGYTSYSGKTGEEGFAQAFDIDGEVGHPLSVYNPRASCTDANGQTASWSLVVALTSGNLPPGMVLDSQTALISGIPTERGHWIVKMNSGTLTCNGQTYMGFSQELRFHITGTGRVVQ